MLQQQTIVLALTSGLLVEPLQPTHNIDGYPAVANAAATAVAGAGATFPAESVRTRS
jgi:hypothetical protein